MSLLPAGAALLDRHPPHFSTAVSSGFQQDLPAASASGFRLVDEAERSRALFWRASFALADSEENFSGWTDGTPWNGWEMSHFERAEAERLIRCLGDERAWFDTERDAFVTLSQDGEDEVWASETVTILDGSAVKVYPVGAGAWTWDEVETRSRGCAMMRANDIVKYSKPVDQEEAKLRFVLLRDPEKGRADIQLVCGYRIKPVETVEVGEIEVVSEP